MKKLVLFLVFLAIINGIESAAQPNHANQNLLEGSLYNKKSSDGWGYEIFSGCWFNVQTGQMSLTDPRNNTVNVPKALSR